MYNVLCMVLQLPEICAHHICWLQLLAGSAVQYAAVVAFLRSTRLLLPMHLSLHSAEVVCIIIKKRAQENDVPDALASASAASLAEKSKKSCSEFTALYYYHHIKNNRYYCCLFSTNDSARDAVRPSDKQRTLPCPACM